MFGVIVVLLVGAGAMYVVIRRRSPQPSEKRLVRMASPSTQLGAEPHSQIAYVGGYVGAVAVALLTLLVAVKSFDRGAWTLLFAIVPIIASAGMISSRAWWMLFPKLFASAGVLAAWVYACETFGIWARSRSSSNTPLATIIIVALTAGLAWLFSVKSGISPATARRPRLAHLAGVGVFLIVAGGVHLQHVSAESSALEAQKAEAEGKLADSRARQAEIAANFDAAIAKGRALFSEGRYEDAVAFADDMLAVRPADTGALQIREDAASTIELNRKVIEARRAADREREDALRREKDAEEARQKNAAQDAVAADALRAMNQCSQACNGQLNRCRAAFGASNCRDFEPEAERCSRGCYAPLGIASDAEQRGEVWQEGTWSAWERVDGQLCQYKTSTSRTSVAIEVACKSELTGASTCSSSTRCPRAQGQLCLQPAHATGSSGTCGTVNGAVLRYLAK